MLELLLLIWVWATGLSVAVLAVVMAAQRLAQALSRPRALSEPYPAEQAVPAGALARSA